MISDDHVTSKKYKRPRNQSILALRVRRNVSFKTAVVLIRDALRNEGVVIAENYLCLKPDLNQRRRCIGNRVA